MDCEQTYAQRLASLLAAVLLAGLLPAVATAKSASPPGYEGFTSTQCIPFTNAKTQGQPFTEAPKVSITVGGRRHVVTMDTGSVGIALSAKLIKNYETLVKTEKGVTQGWSFLSSSKRLWVGHWVPMTVTFHDLAGKPIATSSIAVLGVEQEVICPAYTSGPTCPGTALKTASRGIVYMGVGFGREKDHQPQGTPDKNALLNITRIGQAPVAPQSLRRGYIISPIGVTVGLTAANTAGFDLVQLSASLLHAGDWQELPMCISMNQSPCVSGSALIDTGIPQMYLTVPSSLKFQSIQEKDLSMRNRTLDVLAPGTAVTINIPVAQAPKASYKFNVGDTGNPTAPAQAIPSVSDTRSPFVNTGRHFLRAFQFLYDADGGQVGLRRLGDTKTVGSACGG